MELTMQERVERVAIWAGFKYSPPICDCAICSSMSWIAPDADIAFNGKPFHSSLPNFPESLDACFHPEYGLVRKLDGYAIANRPEESSRCRVSIRIVNRYFRADAETPSLALFKAVEVAIDQEEKENATNT